MADHPPPPPAPRSPLPALTHPILVPPHRSLTTHRRSYLLNLRTNTANHSSTSPPADPARLMIAFSPTLLPLDPHASPADQLAVLTQLKNHLIGHTQRKQDLVAQPGAAEW